MGHVEDTLVHMVKESGGWRRWSVAFIVFGLAIAATFLLVPSFFPGQTFLDRLDASYTVLWERTTRRQFTEIMQENPWLLIIPGGTVIFLSGLLLPISAWSRAALVYVAFGIGFVFGHVFW
jgi:hypothetical protein